MKRASLIETVEIYLEEMGFSRGQFLWQPRSCELFVVLNQGIKAVKLRTGMTKRELIFQMGRLAGLAEAAGITAPIKQHPSAVARKANGASHPALRAGNAMAMGMPA